MTTTNDDSTRFSLLEVDGPTEREKQLAREQMMVEEAAPAPIMDQPKKRGRKPKAIIETPSEPVVVAPVVDGVEEFVKRKRSEKTLSQAKQEQRAAKAVEVVEVAPKKSTEVVNKKNPKNLIATQTASELTGATVWWQLSGSVSIAVLVKAFEAEKLDPKLLLSAQASPEILIHRIAKMEGGVGFIVRKHPKGGWSVVKQEKVDNSDSVWDSRKGIRVYLDAENKPRVDAPTVGVLENIETIRIRVVERFNAQRDEFSAKDVSKWLTRFVSVNLSGASLRWNGGMYFIPNEHVPTYQAMERAFAATTQHSIYEMPTMSSKSTIRAIFDAVRREAIEEITRIENEVNAGEIGSKVQQARLQQLEEISAKVFNYEKLFGQKFGDTGENIERVRKMVAATATRGSLLEVD